MVVNWFDGVMLLIIIVTTVIGYFRGAVGMVLSLAGGIISAILSRALGSNLAPWIYENFVKKGIDKKISETIYDVFQSGIDNIGDSVFNSLPSFIWEFTDGSDVIYSLNSVTGNTLDEISYSASEIVHSIAEPIYNSIISVCVTIILFIIFNVAIGIICKVTGVINKIPIVGAANRAIGVVIGLLYGFLLSAIITFALAVASPLVDTEGVFKEKVEDTSFLFSMVNKNREKLYGLDSETKEVDYIENYNYDDYDDYNYEYDSYSNDNGYNDEYYNGYDNNYYENNYYDESVDYEYSYNEDYSDY